MKKVLLLLAPVAMLSGCYGHLIVPSINLDAKTSSAMSNKTLVLTAYEKPFFKTYSANDAGFAAAGFIVTHPDGNKVVATHGIDDPAVVIGRELAPLLANAYGSKTLPTPVMVTDNNPAALAAAAQGRAQYVLDIRTIHWGLEKVPHDRAGYRVVYYGSAILVDTVTKASVAQGVCGHYRESIVNPPSFEQLAANDAQLLKKELALAVSECVETYAKGIFITK